MLIYRVAVLLAIDRLFDYCANNDELPARLGARLDVPFGNSSKIAVLIAIVKHSDYPIEQLKPINRIIDIQPLWSNRELALLQWVSHYYHYPLGRVLHAALPARLRQGHSAALHNIPHYALTPLGLLIDVSTLNRASQQQKLLTALQHNAPNALTREQLAAHSASAGWRNALNTLIAKKYVLTISTPNNLAPITETSPDFSCNSQQQQAIDKIAAHHNSFNVFLLEGVTGSGKTEVYLQLMAQVLARGEQVLLLVPEINLTPQLEQRLHHRFQTKIALFHSQLTDKQRQQAWLNIQQGVAAILLGTRSALFTPFKKLGLIILDEEHDSSFKQQEGLRFSARDVAVMRGKLQHVPVVLGTATPSLNSLYNVSQGRYQLLRLTERAGYATPPQMRILDIRNQRLQEGLSPPLIEAIQQTLAKQQQVLLFINRRGFAPTLMCHSCAWVARCQQCAANVVMHRQQQQLRCHHCGQVYAIPQHCPACQANTLIPLGCGTERIEQLLTRLFTDKTIVRLDRDSTQRKGQLEYFLQQINTGAVDIILGTQLLAKGHHFANVTLVAIVDVDSGLFSVDFHAAEKLAQLLIQVSGRAGRGIQAGHVILQTRCPEHPLLITLIKQGYTAFAQAALIERQAAALPPYSYQALLRVQSTNEATPLQFFNDLLALLTPLTPETVYLLGPVAAPMAQRAGQYRYQLLLQSHQRTALHRVVAITESILKNTIKNKYMIQWSLDIDPVDLL